MDQISDSKTLKDYQDFWLNDAFGDIPFNDELLGGFEAEAYQGTTPCGLPSPNSSNPELPGSGRQSPFLPAMSTFSGVCDLQSFDTNLDPVISHLPQQSFFQESCADIDSNTSNFHPSSNPGFSNGNNNSPQVYRQQGEPSMTSSNFADAGPYQTFTVPIEGPLCISEDPFQNLAAIGQSNEAFDETALFGGAISTQVSNALNNTSCASEAAETQHSLQLKSQHSEYPSHLCNSIHPGLQQDSPFTLNDSASQATHAMSSSHNLINHQAPYTSPSQINHRNVQRSPNGPPHRRIASAHNLNRGSPVSQNHQPIHESKLRTSVASSSLQNNPLETGQIQTTNYSDLQPMSRQQSIRPPYTGHHHVAGLDMNPRTSYSAEHYGMQSSDHPEVSFIGQGSTHFGFNGSSPLSAKREISSPDSEYVATISNSKSQTASPKPQKKGRVKQESRNDNDNEVVVNPIALQTADLTNMSPIDHKNVTALIKAMHNTDNVEDNDGMKKTWLKVRKTKALRIREVCVELLVSLA